MNELFREILIFLAQRYAADVQNYGESDLACQQGVQSLLFFHIDEATLETLLDQFPDKGEVASWGSWLFLPAPERGHLRAPVLNVIYDFQQQPAVVSIQAGLFYLDQDEPKAVGWRYESPERLGADGAPGMHGYYHAQPSPAIRTESGDHALPLADETIPTGHPTLPLDAADEVDLLLCMMLSIYGLTRTRELISAADLKEANKRLNAMRTVKAGAPA